MTGAGSLAKALVSRRWLWVTLVVLALMAVLARLGFWQLDRLEQRRAENALLIQALESEPIDLNARMADYAGISPAEVPESLANRDVVMVGEFDYEHQYILKLQNWQGRAGVHLITPFVPNGSDTGVLVDRGWIPDSDYQAAQLYDDATGVQTVEGYIALTETISRLANDEVAATNDPANGLFRVDVASLQKVSPHELAPFYVKLAAANGTLQPETLPVPVPKEVDLSEGPHLDYALQWFVFSVGLGIAYVVFVRRSLARDERQEPRIDMD